MTWKLFTNINHRKIAVYTVRLSCKEKIFLSRSIMTKLMLQQGHVCQVWYDAATKRVAISFGLAFDTTPLLIRGLKQQNAYINVRGFFKFFCLKPALKDIKVQAKFDSTTTLTFKLP